MCLGTLAQRSSAIRRKFPDSIVADLDQTRIRE